MPRTGVQTRPDDRSTRKDLTRSLAQNSSLLTAVALQDHFARQLKIPGGGLKPASLKPGAQLTLAQRYGLIQRPPALLTKQHHVFHQQCIDSFERYAKLQDGSERVMKQLESEKDDIDALFAELDASLDQSRQVFDMVDARSSPATRSQERSRHTAFVDAAATSTSGQSHAAATGSVANTVVPWDEVDV
ncbi:hypothetical protein WJX72_007853 [[Myrmecia] bisecta]|uniref:BLOC-1-related complex subunit 5 n=1 Tax=[Myrmecia] bisecta TaxID=41462 RepID=A0AAW1PM28_9CHLO